ncbi:MAG TPA: orotidine-5'-phosphate decarboxylase [Fimbriimonadaceae bacterium]|nr:orotidine-5'-phosphate decarboxylase [Fimbriimonadaceae bacterium]
MVRKVICALDTGDLDEAIATTKRLSPHVGAFKIGHALTLPYGLDVINRLQDAGASRIFLDLKFHDIPNSVALAVREAAKHRVWMMTLHIAGGPAMMTAAVEEARACPEAECPMLVGVSVLTSLDQHTLTDHLGIGRSVEEHMVYLSRLAIDCGLDGVVCSAHEIEPIRKAIGHPGVIVTPGIRLPHGEPHDQRRVADAATALEKGADYLVIGRALTASQDVEATLEQFGFATASA